MKSRKSIILMSILIVLTVIFAFWHLSTREEIPENALSISYKEETYLVDIDKLELKQVTGTRVNGKGEEKTVDALGIALKDILMAENIIDYSSVKVVAEDSYTAQLTADEVKELNKVYMISEDNELRLIVFGDTNSKRSVSDIAQVIVE